MCIMSTPISTNIKKLIQTHPHNTVLTTEEMVRLGLSRELQRSAVRAGWLSRIGAGAYTVLEESVNLEGAIYTLQKELGLSVHQGGYTILNEKYGKTHNLTVDRKPQLFCYRGEKIPAWFRANYCSSYDLFITSFLPSNLGFQDYDAVNFSVKIPVLERAMLEMLYLTPSVHTLKETYQVVELLGTAKPAVVQNLLESCTSIKVKRLFLYMAERAGLVWLKKLDPSTIDLGRGDREITKGGQYDKKYHIVIGDVESI